MFKRLAVIGAFATLISSVAAAPVAAQTGVSITIGHHGNPVAVASVGPYSGYVWQPEHYVWTGNGYQLVPGAWVPGPYAVPQTYYGQPYYGYYPYYYSPHSTFWGGLAGLALGLNFGGHHHGHDFDHGHFEHGHGFGHGHGHH